MFRPLISTLGRSSKNIIAENSSKVFKVQPCVSNSFFVASFHKSQYVFQDNWSTGDDSWWNDMSAGTPTQNSTNDNSMSGTSGNFGDSSIEAEDNTPTNRISYQIYHASKTPEKGGALQLGFAAAMEKRRASIFLTMAKQLGEKLPPGVSGKQFDWEKKIIMKLSVEEAAKIRLVLNGIEKEASFYHKSTKNMSEVVTTLKIQKTDYNIFVGLRREAGENSGAVQIGLDKAQCLLVGQFLETCSIKSFGFK